MNCISVWVVPRAPVVKALYLSVRETGTFTRSGTHQAGWRGSDMGKWKEIGRLLINRSGRQAVLPQLTMFDRFAPSKLTAEVAFRGVASGTSYSRHLRGV